MVKAYGVSDSTALYIFMLAQDSREETILKIHEEMNTAKRLYSFQSKCIVEENAFVHIASYL